MDMCIYLKFSDVWLKECETVETDGRETDYVQIPSDLFTRAFRSVEVNIFYLSFKS